MKFHYQVLSSEWYNNPEVLLDSRNMEEFEGYDTVQKAFNAARNSAQDNGIESYDIEIIVNTNTLDHYLY